MRLRPKLALDNGGAFSMHAALKSIIYLARCSHALKGALDSVRQGVRSPFAFDRSLLFVLHSGPPGRDLASPSASWGSSSCN